MRRAASALLLAAVAAGTAGCESTQSKSARLERESAGREGSETGLRVTERARGVKVTSTALLTDPNGTALVVELRNTGAQALARVPLAVNVKGPGGASVYRNDTPGLETSLVSAALLPPRATQVWVNDQIAPSGPARRARALAGAGGRAVNADFPRLTVSGLALERDETSGLAAVGRVRNRSDVDQRDLVVSVVARRGGRVTAAGRAVVRRLKGKGDAAFTAFLIGDPRRARLEATAPPTTLP